MAPTVGLVMICRNEEKNIRRALESVRPWISTWVIVDTGSTDGTKNVIRDTFSDISGYLEDRPWMNFGYNRTEALELCRGRMDWAIMLDADDNMAGDVPPSELWSTDVDGVALSVHHGGIVHQRVQIFRITADWCYKGVLHEYPFCKSKDSPKLVILPPQKTWMETRCEGMRSRDPNKYIKDALLLEAEHYKSPSDMRTVFYLAQSYRDAGRPIDAQLWYQKYAESEGGSVQEKYISVLNLIALVPDARRVMEYAWAGVSLCPDRLDVQFAALMRFVKEKWPVTQQHYALVAMTENRQTRVEWLFVSPDIYAFQYDDLLGNVAMALGHFKEAAAAFIRCAKNVSTDELRLKCLNNARAAEQKIIEGGRLP